VDLAVPVTTGDHDRVIRIGVDTGGTFTDVVAVDTGSGRIVTTKTPSTPTDPAEGFLAGIDKILGLIGAPPSQISGILHGTTVATNQLLEGKVGALGFITTTGYESMLEIARQSVPDGYGNSYFWVKPDRIVPADLVRTVGGRLDHLGREIRPFDPQAAREAVEFFAARGITALAVCFLHSYANAEHEREMAKVIAEHHPRAVFSLSSQVLPEYREYERAMTTLIDAAVKPTVASYVSGIARRLEALDGGRRIPFSIMRSNGGVLSAAGVVDQPISTVLSGPAAGALGAAVIADRAGFRSVVTCDGGGTSTDVSVITDARPSLTTEGSVGPFPAKIPMIDIVTVGAGGGSVAWLSAEGALKVGPRSAGADPGPACYRRGGSEPTVTDAHLVLGRIPAHLLGGEIPLDVEAATAAIGEVAGPLGLTIEDCAAGILEISAWNQANALRRITTKRGLDVRDFPMVTFGGSGSLLACRLMDILEIGTVLVPPNPGNVSASGLLTVDVRGDYVRTAVCPDRRLDIGDLAELYRGLTEQAREALRREGFESGRQIIERSADLRYVGQAFEVRVDCPDGEISRDWADAVVGAFHDAHRALYGYDFRGVGEQHVEWVNLRVTGVGPIPRPPIDEIAVGDGSVARATLEGRQAHFDGWLATLVVDRERLGAGDVVQGPAVVQEFGSTVPIPPGFRGTVDRFGNLLLTRVGS